LSDPTQVRGGQRFEDVRFQAVSPSRPIIVNDFTFGAKACGQALCELDLVASSERTPIQ
jgi:hypothetical protein